MLLMQYSPCKADVLVNITDRLVVSL